MNFVFVTPVVSRSAIGRSCGLIIEALKNSGHSVSIIRSESATHLSEKPHRFASRSLPWTDAKGVSSLLAEADIAVYQLGNYIVYHEGALVLLDQYPGIVILHDYFLGNLFLGWAKSSGEEAARSTISAWYGAQAVDDFFAAAARETFLEEAAPRFPMTEWVASKALGVITHSSLDIGRIVSACGGPIAVLPLAYDAPLAALKDKSRCRPADRRVLLTFGHINRNKRAESVIRAIGEDQRLRTAWVYRLVGQIMPAERQYLETLANGLGVAIEIVGPVDDEALAKAIIEADLISCLRYPALEAASASAIEAMLYGKVVLVTDAGFYRGLPSDCVIKVQPDVELQDIRKALQAVTKSESGLSELGERAQTWAKETSDPGSYAHGLVDFAHCVLRSAPVSMAARSIGQTLARWGASANFGALKQVTQSLSLLAGSPGASEVTCSTDLAIGNALVKERLA